MKRKTISSMFTLLLSTTCLSIYAQEISSDKIPGAVTDAFKAKFSNAEDVKWEMGNEKNYEANFEINEMEQSAVFDENGNWMETESEMNIADLPPTVNEAIVKQFTDYKINEAEKVEKPGGGFYEVELSKGKEILDVTLSSTGEVLEKKAKEENDKEDKN